MESSSGPKIELVHQLDLRAPQAHRCRRCSPSLVFAWQTELVRLSRVGKLEREFVSTISLSVSSMRGQANDLMSCLDRDKPYSYASLCGLLVNINL